MNTLINKRIVSSLAVLAIMASGAILAPMTASADSNSGGYVNPYNRSTFSDGGVNTGATSSSTTQTKSVAVARTTSTKVASTSNSVVKSDTLTANAVSTSNTSMFSGLLAWIFIAILILLIVILARKIFGADKKYQSAPMKQA